MSHNMTYNFRKRNPMLNYNEEKHSFAQNKDMEIVKVVAKNVRVKRPKDKPAKLPFKRCRSMAPLVASTQMENMAVVNEQKVNIEEPKTDSKLAPVLYFDIVRDVFANFDRRTLCRLQIVNKRFNLIMEKEFNNSPPYLFMPELQYENKQWAIKFENNLAVPVNFTVIQKIIASKFIRVRLLRTLFDENFHPMQLLDMSHVWENGELRVFWTNIQGFQPTEDFSRSLSNCGKLYVYGSKALSILVLNSVKYRVIQIYDYDPILQEVPWAKITDYLFSPVQNYDFHIYITTVRPPNRKETVKFVNFVKERFQAVEVAVNFTFFWCASYKEWTVPEIDIQNNQTKQRLELLSCSKGFKIKVY